MSVANPPSLLRIQVRPEAVSSVAGAIPQSLLINSRNRICFRHPHYRPPTNVLLDLFAPDSPVGGLEYGFAHVACAMVAGNRWDGFFTNQLDGPRLQFTYGDIMSDHEYYFHIEGSTPEDPYPVVPTFRQWPFPHNDLPPSWAESIQPLSSTSGRSYAPSNFSSAINAQNVTCRMTDGEEGTEAAHLCPRSELEWSQHNQMSIYNTSPSLPPDKILDDMANALLLRQDLHTQFDANKFVYVPKQGAETTETKSIVTHLLMPSQELGLLYHNVQLKPIHNVHPAFLLARFALSIFRFSEQFIAAGVDRNILGIDGVPKMIQGNVCKNLTARTRSQSPTKRSKRTLPNDVDGDGGLLDEIEQPCLKRRRHSQSFRSTGTGTVESQKGLTGTDATASEEEPQTPEKQSDKTSRLRKEWLENERRRSDTGNIWAQQQEWDQRIWDGRTLMSPKEARRFYELNGIEIEE